jgi:hypothetical protein
LLSEKKSGLNVPVAVATPATTVHEVGTNTAGSSPEVDSGTEVRTGIVIVGPTDVSGAALATGLDGGALGGALDGGALDGGAVSGGEEVAAAGGDELVAEGDPDCDTEGESGADARRLPACLPKKKAPTHSPTRRTAPRDASFRFVDGLIELTWPVI